MWGSVPELIDSALREGGWVPRKVSISETRPVGGNVLKSIWLLGITGERDIYQRFPLRFVGSLRIFWSGDKCPPLLFPIYGSLLRYCLLVFIYCLYSRTTWVSTSFWSFLSCVLDRLVLPCFVWTTGVYLLGDLVEFCITFWWRPVLCGSLVTFVITLFSCIYAYIIPPLCISIFMRSISFVDTILTFVPALEEIG